MIKSWSVFIRNNAEGNGGDDMNVVAQHHKTYAGIVRADSRERAGINAVQKTGQPEPFLLIFEGAVAVGENAAFCPYCGKNLNGPITEPHPFFTELGWSGLTLTEKLEDMQSVMEDNKYRCVHCDRTFTGKVETVTRTIFFQAQGE